jgi:hypothetical protein
MRKNFPPEYPKDVMEKARAEIRAYCCEKNILHDIDYIERLPYSEEALKSFSLNLRVASNEHTFGGNGFVHTEMLGAIFKHFKRTGHPRVVFPFDAYLDFYAKQIKYFEGCVIKRSDYSVSTGKTSRQWSKENMSITDFVRDRWNWGKFEMADYLDNKDGNGNIYYLRYREGLAKLMEVKHDKENGD